MISHPEIHIPLIAGFILDALFGDPHFLPHPIRLFGNVISFGEKRLNKGKRQKLKGAILALSLILVVFFLFYLLLKFLERNEIVWLVVSSVFVFYGLANRSLIQEALKVITVLDCDGIDAGRKQLSMIVGRDTTRLNGNQIRTAVLETLAENLSDGVIAPLFFYAIGGVPAMLAYKMANTLDSMVAYNSDRFKNFGWFAAKIDDVLNFIPARITSILMVFVAFSSRGLQFIFKYGKQHSSPNAGYPEAALAGILNCRFGGPNIYHGKLVDKPFIGKNSRELFDADVRKACWVNFSVALVSVVLIILWYM